MTATELLVEVRRRGVELVAAGEQLRFRPRNAVDPDLLGQLRQHKTEMLTILRLGSTPRDVAPDDLPPDWRVEWEERAAIREIEGGQAREHAEAEALREIVTRMRAAE